MDTHVSDSSYIHCLHQIDTVESSALHYLRSMELLLHDQNEGSHELELFHTKRCVQLWRIPSGAS
jgi:hypothetical protein